MICLYFHLCSKSPHTVKILYRIYQFERLWKRFNLPGKLTLTLKYKTSLKHSQFNAEVFIGVRIQLIGHHLRAFSYYSHIVVNSAHKLSTKQHFILFLNLLLLVYSLLTGVH